MTSNASSNVVGVHYRVGKKIGEGSFGVLFEGTNMLNNQQIAIKFEPRKSDAPQLRDEYRTYKVLVGCPGIPNVYYFGQEGLHNILVMDLLGPSLEDLFDYCNRQFSVKTTVMIAKQMISRIQHVHEKNFVYRDIKPDNFLIGRPGSKMATVVHVVDFGMAKQYRDPKTKQHIPYRERKALSGTARYMSINTHLGREQSRRDDLEALGHVFLYFLRGGLPWQGMRAANNKVKYEKIGEKKQMISAKELCDGYPDEFRIYLEYCRNLGFEETPDYDYLRELLTKALRNAGQVEDGEYDFMLINDGKGWDAPHKYTSDRPAAAVGNATTREIHSGRPAPAKAQVSDDRLNAALPKPGATWPRNKPAVGDRRRTDQRFTDPTPGQSGSGQYQDRVAMQRARDSHGANNLGTNGRQSEPSSALQSREDTPTQPHAQAPITAAQPQPARRQSNVVRTMDADANAGQRQQESGTKGFFKKLCCQA